MQKYLFHGSYTPEGYKGLMAEGGSRRIEAAKQALGSVGGSLEAFYFSFGMEDFYIIVNLPDNVTATSVLMAGMSAARFTSRVSPADRRGDGRGREEERRFPPAGTLTRGACHS